MAKCNKCGIETSQGAKFCKACGTGLEDQNTGTDDKKARVLAGRRKGPSATVVVGTLLALGAMGWLVYAMLLQPDRAGNRLRSQAQSDAERSQDFTPVEARNGEVQVSLASLPDRSARYFIYRAKDRDVKFFVLRASDGTIRAALDSCMSCYHAKLGYRQDGDAMVCNNCGMSFRSTEVGHIAGGCSPIPLSNSHDGRTLVVRASDLEAGARYF
jgi:hypothetical protein